MENAFIIRIHLTSGEDFHAEVTKPDMNSIYDSVKEGSLIEVEAVRKGDGRTWVSGGHIVKIEEQ